MQDFVGAKGVIPAEQLAKLSERSNWQGLVQLFLAGTAELIHLRLACTVYG